MRSYIVTVDGLPYRMRMSAEQAERRGAVPVETAAPKKATEPKAVKPANKARAAANKSK